MKKLCTSSVSSVKKLSVDLARSLFARLMIRAAEGKSTADLRRPPYREDHFPHHALCMLIIRKGRRDLAEMLYRYVSIYYEFIHGVGTTTKLDSEIVLETTYLWFSNASRI